MTTFIPHIPQTRIPAAYYRPPSYIQAAPPRADVRDDYERWYTETVPNNRMSLSIRSGIHSEISWALDRICRLVHNETFMFASLPGVIDGLFDWPEWYINEGHKLAKDSDLLFSSSQEQARQRRFALESLFVLRNAALHEPNAEELMTHSHTVPLILNGLHNLDHTKDENVEALLHIIDILCVMAPRYPVYPSTPPRLNPIPPLLRIVKESTNRTLIITSLSALTFLFSNPPNAPYLEPNSPALTASIQYLPLFMDKPLLDACLNYLYCHISHPAMARAFLFNSEMPGVLRLLTSLILQEQQTLEKTFTLDKTGPIYTSSSTSQATRDHELTKEELEDLIAKPEPQRCYDWMKTMFVSKVDGELTQVDFWNMYKDTFAPYSEPHPLLVASDVIKNVTNVFPQAQAMVLPGPSQRFIVRGVDRRKVSAANERYRCQWDRGQCSAQPLSSPAELFDHVLEHLAPVDSNDFPCLWATCPRPPLSKPALTSHILTHLSSAQPSQKHPSQSDTITLPGENYPYPTDTPTSRPAPPPRSTTITYQMPIIDPPTTSLTALLVLRILFRTSFASVDAAPRVDSDHFGFPGLVEEDEPDELDTTDRGGIVDEREGERRGRKAFVGVRRLLEGVRIRDEALMGWISEMVNEV
ncbi:hypothetical protein BDN70DRAFT_821842 [Pholiota conissans]|uniref:RFX-type winged-helix domain-containing protein n=1 Tax=Pholiota conissans TaxID=109636 RepID=A0A9P5ZH35_9AGAR|nr:hypothetical protein BDN70DRAFT_821842 [Pholiota conissans]